VGILSDAATFAQILYLLATLAIAAAGLAIMVGFRQFGVRLFAVGVFLPVAGAMSPLWLTGEPGSVFLLWNAVIGTSATIGGCLIILGQHQAGWALAMPAINRFLIIPTLAPVLAETPLEILLTALFVVSILGGPLLVRRMLHRAIVERDHDSV
jgi:hypothetical protein